MRLARTLSWLIDCFLVICWYSLSLFKVVLFLISGKLLLQLIAAVNKCIHSFCPNFQYNCNKLQTPHITHVLKIWRNRINFAQIGLQFVSLMATIWTQAASAAAAAAGPLMRPIQAGFVRWQTWNNADMTCRPIVACNDARIVSSNLLPRYFQKRHKSSLQFSWVVCRPKTLDSADEVEGVIGLYWHVSGRLMCGVRSASTFSSRVGFTGTGRRI